MLHICCLVVSLNLIGYAKLQGFGEFDNTITHLKANGDREVGGKKNPFHEQDDRISPQQTLQDQMQSSDVDMFNEKTNYGTLEFGDSMLNKYQVKRLFTNSIPIGEVAVMEEKLRWTNAVIPYEIHCSLINLKDARAAIDAAIKEWESKTCVRFVERKTEKKYLQFYRGTSCWGHVGMQEHSTISVGYGCERQNIMAHEIGHALGLLHEHNRKDRDDHVDILYENVVSEEEDNFKTVRIGSTYGLPYDYSSIMHYPWNAFGKGGLRTIKPKSWTGKKPYKEISDNDIKQVRLMYKCNDVERKWKDFEQLARDTTPQRAPKPRPPSADEWGIFSAMQNAPGEPGCVDWSNNCKDWSNAGYCQSQAIVRQYCKKTCNEPVCTANECKDRHPKCKSYGRFCHHKNYKTWMKENCCAFCSKEIVPECRDTRDFCKEYVQYGYCSSSKNFRETYCCRTCKDAPTTPKPKQTCTKDIRSDCKSLQDQGHCEQRREYMEDNCCITCRDKSNKKEECTKDIRSDCVNLKNSDYCTKSKDYMKKYCCVTCSDGVKKVTKKCDKDIYEDCESLKQQGQCERNRELMKEKCCVTCKGTVCSKGEKTPLVQPLNSQFPTFLGTGRLCRNVKDWNPEKCPRWSRMGWCKTKYNEMALWCKRSCKFCDEVGIRPEGVCSNPLGLHHDGQRSELPDSSFKSAQASMSNGLWSAGPENARLYFEDDYINKKIGAWCAKSKKSTMENLQALTIDLGERKRITYIATQGRDKYFERVSKFKIEYSNTGEPDDFCPYVENGVEKIFEGNCDHVTPVLNQFWTPLEARYIKFIPWKYNYPCVRLELYGCRISEIQPVP